MLEPFFVIPVYNDWVSLNILLKKINSLLKKNKIKFNILIIDDNSSRIKLNITKKLNYCKLVKIIQLKKNNGSQIAISIGLRFLKKIKKKFLVLVMDSDGEDNPREIIKLILEAKKYKNEIIVSTRTKRNENLLFKIFYTLHKILIWVFTFKWISFGNFSCFCNQNLRSLLADNSSNYSISSSYIKNCKIRRIRGIRLKRITGDSKVSYFGLVMHSFRVACPFIKKIFITSFFYIFLLNSIFIESKISFFLTTSIAIYNILIFFTYCKYYKINTKKISTFNLKTN